MPEVEVKAGQMQDVAKQAEPAVGYFRHVEKRTGEKVEFDLSKIRSAIFRAAHSVGGEDRDLAEELAHKVCKYLRELRGDHVPKVEDVQDAVEKVLIESGHARTAKAFILYREKRARQRRGTNREGIKKLLAGKKEATDLPCSCRRPARRSPDGTGTAFRGRSCARPTSMRPRPTRSRSRLRVSSSTPG